MSYSQSLDKQMSTLRANSIKLLERRKALQAIESPTEADLKELEKIRVKINASRKEERFLKNTIKQMRNRFA